MVGPLNLTVLLTVTICLIFTHFFPSFHGLPQLGTCPHTKRSRGRPPAQPQLTATPLPPPFQLPTPAARRPAPSLQADRSSHQLSTTKIPVSLLHKCHCPGTHMDAQPTGSFALYSHNPHKLIRPPHLSKPTETFQCPRCSFLLLNIQPSSLTASIYSKPWRFTHKNEALMPLQTGAHTA